MQNKLGKLIVARLLSQSACMAAVSTVSSFAVCSTAVAQEWNYFSDTSGDSLDVTYGPGWHTQYQSFDIKGMGLKQDDNDVWFGISADMHEGGHHTTQYLGPNLWVDDSNVGWGDLFLDFSGNDSFEQASQNRELLGIRFATANDSEAVSTGVYRNVKGAGVQSQNGGRPNLKVYQDALAAKKPGQGASVGQLSMTDTYWGAYATDSASVMPNVIDSAAERIGDITFLNYAELYSNGFSYTPDSFSHGSFLFGFKVSKALLPEGDFIATLIEECLNDSIAFRSSILGVTEDEKEYDEWTDEDVIEEEENEYQEVPENNGLVGLLAFSLLFPKAIKYMCQGSSRDKK